MGSGNSMLSTLKANGKSTSTKASKHNSSDHDREKKLMDKIKGLKSENKKLVSVL